ncbi:MAG: proliferating cell nuclear antigen (pcna) [Sulfolobaceae archaeon]|nr:proliferating cell nuclear antigen (pcna) [Sulfolobaceae archaeon]
MAKLKLADAVGFKDIITTLSEFLDEATFVLSKEGLKINGMDSSKVVLIDLFMPASYFDTYEVEQDQLKVGFNLEDFADVIKRAEKEDAVSIEIEEGKVRLFYDGEFEREFELPTIQASETEMPSLNLDLPIRAKTLTITFADIIDSLAEIGEAITFEAKQDKIVLKTAGDLGESAVELSQANGMLLEYEGGEASSTYGMEYIENTTKVARASDTLEIRFGSQLPAKLHYELPQGGYFDFYIAPRAE